MSRSEPEGVARSRERGVTEEASPESPHGLQKAVTPPTWETTG
jgi:hypothetical protein